MNSKQIFMIVTIIAALSSSDDCDTCYGTDGRQRKYGESDHWKYDLWKYDWWKYDRPSQWAWRHLVPNDPGDVYQEQEGAN